MNFSRVFRFSIAALALLSVAWKIAVFSLVPDDSIRRIGGFLTRHDFDVASPEQFLNTGTTVAEASIIHATNSICKLSIAQLTVDGANRQMIESIFAGADRRFVVFRGATYSAAPKFAILESYIWARFAKDLGISAPTLPVLEVASDASCHAEALPWREL